MLCHGSQDGFERLLAPGTAQPRRAFSEERRSLFTSRPGREAGPFRYVLGRSSPRRVVASGGELIRVLVLTRKTKQSIMIGDEIEISILSVAGEKVRIGIDAPGEVPVFRKEVWLRIAAERNGDVGASAERS